RAGRDGALAGAGPAGAGAAAGPGRAAGAGAGGLRGGARGPAAVRGGCGAGAGGGDPGGRGPAAPGRVTARAAVPAGRSGPAAGPTVKRRSSRRTDSVEIASAMLTQKSG